MKAIFKSDIGKVRKINQDWAEVKNYPDNSCLVIVCDGIGGVAGGEVASKAAALEICDYFEKNQELKIKSRILESIKNANNKILNIAKSDNKIPDLGTTCVVVFVQNNNLDNNLYVAYIANVGDSRAYLISENKIKQITCDHSVVNELLMQGKITSDEAKNSNNKNIITRALGCSNSTPDFYEINIKSNDKILICTDGLTNCLSNKEIYKILDKNSPEKAIENLINSANQNGGTDNITVALIF
ncbi:MAG: Stp1/IreP family PP2C-type Ser/Thr phosphatase [Clostridia bacterium]|nr:Stp1/IreP family PP2C-type Ser/Thr phosphatase [Clostridia bacterium]